MFVLPIYIFTYIPRRRWRYNTLYRIYIYSLRMLHSRLFYSPHPLHKIYLLSGRVVRESPGYRFACCPGYTYILHTLYLLDFGDLYYSEYILEKIYILNGNGSIHICMYLKSKQANTHTTHGWV